MVPDTIRNTNIDIMRLIFAFFIVFYHVRYVVHRSIYDFPQNGYLAVDFFFIVSGYFIIKSCRDNQEKGTENGTLRYCFHKLMSFLPYLIVAEIFFGMVEGFVAIDPDCNFNKNFDLFCAGMWKHLKQILCLSMLNLYGSDITWYLSSLILSTLMLYPFVRRSKVIFPRYIAPTFGILTILTILVVTKAINSPSYVMFGFVCKGLLRGLAEMSLGIFAYELVSIMQGHRFKNDTIVYTVVEITCLFLAFLFIFSGNPFRPDGREVFESLMILLIFVGTTITFSTLSLTYEWVNKVPFLVNNAKWMGIGSLMLYLVHGPVIMIFDNVEWLKDAIYGIRLFFVVLISIGLCFALYFLGKKLGELMSKEIDKAVA